MSIKTIETPECDRQSEIIHSGRAQAVQDFYDWLAAEGYVLAKYQFEETVHCPGTRRDPFDSSNCEDGKVKRTVTQWQGHTRVGKVEAGETCTVCNGTGEVQHTFSNPPLMPVFESPQNLMADHFGIDLNKIETERRAILDALREQS